MKCTLNNDYNLLNICTIATLLCSYFENLWDSYLTLTDILPFPVSPAGFAELNFLCNNCAVPHLTLIYLTTCTVLPAVILIIVVINAESWACETSQFEECTLNESGGCEICSAVSAAEF